MSPLIIFAISDKIYYFSKILSRALREKYFPRRGAKKTSRVFALTLRALREKYFLAKNTKINYIMKRLYLAITNFLTSMNCPDFILI